MKARRSVDVSEVMGQAEESSSVLHGLFLVSCKRGAYQSTQLVDGPLARPFGGFEEEVLHLFRCFTHTLPREGGKIKVRTMR